jgi:hypothetical protein
MVLFCIPVLLGFSFGVFVAAHTSSLSIRDWLSANFDGICGWFRVMLVYHIQTVKKN